MFGWFKKRTKPPTGREELLQRSHPLFREIDSAFKVYVELIAQNPQRSDEQIETELCTRGIQPGLAQDLVVFVPMAFGREVVQQAGVRCSDRYRLHNMADKTEREMPLAHEMVFCWAKAMIGEYRNAERNETLFQKGASRVK